ncbi:MAG: hypothetical protein ACFFD9_10720 [Candidatus Thorarchaeota archaeon]
MRTCTKCGRVNQPTRKHCTRCGASLIGVVKEEKPKASTPVPEIGTVTKGETVEDTRSVPSSTVPDTPETSGDGRLVRPSEVATNRVIAADRHVQKTEFEKAKEIFEQAEEYGIEEGGPGIVETRMLRASEVRELLDSVAEMPQDPDLQASPGPGLPGEPETPAPAIPTPQDIEESILGSKSTLVEQKAEPQPPASVEPVAPETPTPFAPVETPVKTETEVPYQPPVKRAAAPPTEPVSPTPVERAPFVPEVSDALETDLPDPAYANDPKIKKAIADIRQSNVELQRVEYELEGIRSQLDTEVEGYRAAAEEKKIRYEGLREQTLLAKKESELATKDHDNAEKRRKKKISTEEKRIDKLRKQIKKHESARTKRIGELEKEKQRAAERAARG